MDLTKNNSGKVLQFRQDTDFYLKRAAKRMDQNDLLSAAHHYRQAYLSDPTDLDSCLALAEVLTRMQRFEESNRLLLVDISMNDPDPESYFGMACNYYGMHEFSYAKESMETYLTLDPDGYYAFDATEFLDFLEDHRELSETVGLEKDETFETLDVCRFSKRAADRGDYLIAAQTLETYLEKNPTSVRAMNQLSVIRYCVGDGEGALKLAQTVLKKSPFNMQAKCNRVLFLKALNRREEAESELTLLTQSKTENPEVLSALSLLLMEFGRFSEALVCLKKLSNYLPYDEDVLHRMGYCRFMLGDRNGARECYQKLLSIDSDDTVARYYLNTVKTTEPKEHGRYFVLAYRVPVIEILQRFKRINALIVEPYETLQQLWREDRGTRNLLVWALSIPDMNSKLSVLRLIASMNDSDAERILRDFLLRIDQPDAIKREVLALLKRMQARDPFMAYLDGQWVQGSVNIFELPKKLPAAYEAILAYLAEQVTPEFSEACLGGIAKVIHQYIASFDGEFPRISANQEHSLAGALEFLGRKAGGETPDENDIAKRYKISLRRLRNAIQKIEPVLEER